VIVTCNVWPGWAALGAIETIWAGGLIVREAGLELAKLVPVAVLPETDTRYGVGVLTFGPLTLKVMRPPLTGKAANPLT
jgi:hypothetical protein